MLNDEASRIALAANGALGGEVADLLARASRGHIDAQRELRDACANTVIRRWTHIPHHEVLAAYAVIMARLAAAQDDPDDGDSLAAILLNVGIRFAEWNHNDVADSFAAEALSIWERRALSGDEQASEIVQQIVAAMPGLVGPAKALIARGQEPTDA
jgi:hypothetical protein